MSTEDEDDNMGKHDPNLSYVIALSGMGRPDRYLELTTQWRIFSVPAFYDDEGGG